ncbi:MAG: signal peptide peptidase SppA [Candidatus Caenarcaniphilales bacterium]|nr:signal peptide peptidase SppA [Candidatus Caenarcaniphilales bacterium]
MSKDRLFSFLLLSLGLLGIILSFFSSKEKETSPKDISSSIFSTLPSSKDKILSLELTGVMMDGRLNSFLGESASDSVKVRDQLIKASKDKSVKGVLIRINSPGGAVGISQEIYQAAKKVRAKKPIVASMGDVAASGGYYVASMSDLIYANPGTLTGSIGVISHFMNLEGLYGKIGLKDMTVKSGRYKDIGSSTRPMSEEEREILQDLVDDTYEQFVGDVYEGRRTNSNKYGDFRKNLTKDDIRYVAEGMIYTGNQAKQVGLVDELGNYYDALDQLQRMVKKRSKGKVKEDLPVVESIGLPKSFREIIGLSTDLNGGGFSDLGTLLFQQLFNKSQPTLSSSINKANLSLKPPIMLIAPEFVSIK